MKQYEYIFQCGTHKFCRVLMCFTTEERARELAQSYCDRNGYDLLEVKPYEVGGLSIGN